MDQSTASVVPHHAPAARPLSQNLIHTQMLVRRIRISAFDVCVPKFEAWSAPYAGAVPGMRVRSRGKVLDKYERRGRHYMVTQFTTTDEESGTVLMRGQFTQMIFPD